MQAGRGVTSANRGISQSYVLTLEGAFDTSPAAAFCFMDTDIRLHTRTYISGTIIPGESYIMPASADTL